MSWELGQALSSILPSFWDDMRIHHAEDQAGGRKTQGHCPGDLITWIVWSISKVLWMGLVTTGFGILEKVWLPMSVTLLDPRSRWSYSTLADQCQII